MRPAAEFLAAVQVQLSPDWNFHSFVSLLQKMAKMFFLGWAIVLYNIPVCKHSAVRDFPHLLRQVYMDLAFFVKLDFIPFSFLLSLREKGGGVLSMYNRRGTLSSQVLDSFLFADPQNVSYPNFQKETS